MNINACIHDGWLYFDNYDGVLKEYLYYYFKYTRSRLVNQANGSVFKNLKTDIVKEFEIKLPSLKTQRKIVKILQDLDEKIEFNIKIIINFSEFKSPVI
ncbi:MAG: restriction endonuclease subunit S [Methanosphaera sp.]|nr:restriction endonuclease subunit S [Methanosphaera sp.]